MDSESRRLMALIALCAGCNVTPDQHRSSSASSRRSIAHSTQTLHGDGGVDAASVSDGSSADSGDPGQAWVNPVAQENQLPGTTAWALSQPARHREIEGYASAV